MKAVETVSLAVNPDTLPDKVMFTPLLFGGFVLKADVTEILLFWTYEILWHGKPLLVR